MQFLQLLHGAFRGQQVTSFYLKGKWLCDIVYVVIKTTYDNLVVNQADCIGDISRLAIA